MTLRFVLFVLLFLFLFPFAFVIVVVDPLFQQVSFSAEFLLHFTSIRGLDAAPPPFFPVPEEKKPDDQYGDSALK